MQVTRDWPNDADGGVLRLLFGNGFDFSKPHEVDYNIDFKEWPPRPEAIELLRSTYGEVDVYEPDEHGDGYAQFKIVALVSYEGVIATQRQASIAMAPYGGICETWGVMQDAP